MNKREQPCSRLRDCEVRLSPPAADPSNRGLSSAISRLWEQGDTAGRALTSGIDKANTDYAQHIAENPLSDEVSTGMPGLDEALARLRSVSQEVTSELSRSIRSQVLGETALPQCATCPLNPENQQ